MKIWYPELDILKATAILLLVFCHLDNYVSCYEQIRLVDEYAAIIGLSIFFFVSGFLLSQHDSGINSVLDIKKFVKKKLIRIFPLYWIALASLLVIFGLLRISPGNVSPYNFSPTNLFIHFFALQGIFPTYKIQSMWFVGVIILFYLIYTIISYLSQNSYQTILISLSILILLAIVHTFTGLIQGIFYYPIFISGIIINQTIYSSKDINNGNLKQQFFILNCILVALISLIQFFDIFRYLNIQLLSPLLTIFLLICLCNSYLLLTHFFIKLSGRSMEIISSIAFGTYAIYLFQHQFLAIFSLIIHKFIENIVIQDIIVLTIGFAGAIVFGIIIQTIEQHIFERIKLRYSTRFG